MMEQKEKPSDEFDNSPIEQVRLTVPITDDPTLPVLTFRTWLLGPITCVFLAIFKQIMTYRQNQIFIPDSCFTILILPVGKLLAATLPTKPIRIPIVNWTFSMNPGPFNIKEHFVLTILSRSGLNYPLGIVIVVIIKAFYHKNISFWASFLLIQTSQMVGYGFAGLFTKFLVDSPYMWWPAYLPDVSLYRTLHDKVDVRRKGQLRGLQFFIIVSVSSFAYHIIPNYFFPSITALSFVCWIWKDSITAQQIGSGLHGFGIGSFSLDWNTISGFLGSPMVIPMFAILNSMVGFILITYIIVPIAYWTNSYSAKRFTLFSSDLFDANGQSYDVSRILNEDLSLNEQAYNNYSIIYLSIFFVFSTGFTLASETATITHFVLYHARESWNVCKKAWKGRNQFNDVHSRLMKKSYEPIPQWWFYIIIVPMIALALLNSTYFGKEFQLPYWGVLLGYMLPFIFILPVGVINGTTGQGSLDMLGLSQLLFGSIYPGYPLANLAFKFYSTCTLTAALDIIPEFKLGQYMKIPPKSLFIAQIVGSFISYSTSLCTAWWLLSTMDNMCDKKKLPEGSPWTCPIVHVLFSRSMIWGGVGPSRMFAPHGLYSKIYYFFLIGVVATGMVWILSRMFPEKKWIRLTNVPLIFSSAAFMVPTAPVHYWSWFTVGIIFNLVVYRKYKGWWAKYNYDLSNGLAIGSAFLALVTSVSVNIKDVYGLEWWGLLMDDHCPLATCPTSPGIKVDGCPVIH
ncbi:Oligopeptide transporter [Macleaya cordata]|uniref:Oligopeptide transporter n=1 Tax=Macleaya cordata TaxID=56857 RepID=A0A200RAL6_MACCD|nr:Oligopeptide transporter [Macleaya cordata]